MAIVPEGFGAVDFAAGTSSATAASAGGDELSLLSGVIFIMATVFAFSFAQGFLKGVNQAIDEEEAGGADAKAAPASAKARTLKEFGWLQADMRMPLPSWEELQDSCYRVGEFNNHYMYLCAEEKQAANIKQKGECAVSTDFTKHYGHTVYVCQGAAVKDIHGDAWDPSSRT